MRRGTLAPFLAALHAEVDRYPEQYEGLLSHEVLVDEGSSVVVYVSRWRDEAAVAAFAGPDWRGSPRTFPGESEYLLRPLHVRHFAAQFPGADMGTGGLLHRETVPLGVRELAGWPMKLYRITAARPGAGTGPGWWAEALCVAEQVMTAQQLQDRPSAGFVVLHHGEVGNWLLVHWWRGDILCQELRLGTGTQPAFEAAPDHAMACLYELVVLDHERRAWAGHVLGGAGDLPSYLHDAVSASAGQPYR